MLKFLLSIVVIQSVTIIIAGSCIWIRGYSYTDDIFINTPGRMSRFRTSGGGFWFETRPWLKISKKRFTWQRFDNHPYPFKAMKSDPWYARMGFMVSTEGYDLLVVAPYWSIIIPPILILLLLAFQNRFSVKQFKVQDLLILMTAIAIGISVWLRIRGMETGQRPWIIIPLIAFFLATYVAVAPLSIVFCWLGKQNSIKEKAIAN